MRHSQGVLEPEGRTTKETHQDAPSGAAPSGATRSRTDYTGVSALTLPHAGERQNSLATKPGTRSNLERGARQRRALNNHRPRRTPPLLPPLLLPLQMHLPRRLPECDRILPTRLPRCQGHRWRVRPRPRSPAARAVRLAIRRRAPRQRAHPATAIPAAKYRSPRRLQLGRLANRLPARTTAAPGSPVVPPAVSQPSPSACPSSGRPPRS